jgi:hypothetical protein
MILSHGDNTSLFRNDPHRVFAEPILYGHEQFETLHLRAAIRTLPSGV